MMDNMREGSSMLQMCTLMGIAGLLFIVVFGLTIYFVVRSLLWNTKVRDRPLMILRERFARGEIEQEEYMEKQKCLIQK